MSKWHLATVIPTALLTCCISWARAKHVTTPGLAWRAHFCSLLFSHTDDSEKCFKVDRKMGTSTLVLQSLQAQSRLLTDGGDGFCSGYHTHAVPLHPDWWLMSAVERGQRQSIYHSPAQGEIFHFDVYSSHYLLASWFYLDNNKQLLLLINMCNFLIKYFVT